MDTKKRLYNPISIARSKISARFGFSDGKVITVEIPIDAKHWQVYNATQIAEMADQYEADKTLNRALSKESKSKS